MISKRGLLIVLIGLIGLFVDVSGYKKSRKVHHHHHSKHREHADADADADTILYLYLEDGQHSLSTDKLDDTIPVAEAVYRTNTSYGWEEFSVTTSGTFTDEEQAEAAGYLEGHLTSDKIFDLYKVIVQDRYNVLDRNTMDEYTDQQIKFLEEKVEENSAESDYWYNINLILKQLDGVLDGYNDARPDENEKLSKYDLWIINMDGDIFDISIALGTESFNFLEMGNIHRATKKELVTFIELRSRCSALIKWTGDDLYAAHSTWSDYNELYRIYKYYNFNFNHPSIVSQSSSFSSYPGMIFSSDDYYILDSGLMVLETTINILDSSLYDNNNPSESVMAWIRNVVANRVATDGKSWTDTYGQHNSGTYNNQWMIVDYNKFTPGADTLKPGTLWLLEQIPNKVEARDITEVLQNQTYWASYNRPYFKEINEKSMFLHFTSQYGQMFSYKECPRAKIFARENEEGRMENMDDIKRLMRLNQYKTDPLSKGCPGNAIAARFDLPAVRGADCDVPISPNGASDAKVTNFSMFRQMKVETVFGPTTDDQPAFTWEKNKRFTRYDGLMDKYDFKWTTLSPITPQIL